jgi:MFS family permease
LAVLPTPSMAPVAAALSRRGIHYAWLVVIATFAALMVSAAIRALPGVLIHPFEAEFGWQRDWITIGVAINILLYGISGPIVGRWMDTKGPRIVTLGAVALLLLGGLATLTITQVWQFDLYWGLIVGTGAGGIAMVLVASIVSRWFDTRRGLVTGILGVAVSTGQIIFIPVVMWLSVTVGWRVGVLAALALLAGVVLPLLLFVFRDDPAQVGLRRFGAGDVAATNAPAGPSGETTPMRQVVRTPDFWWLAGGFFVCGYTTNGLMGTHFISHATEHGIAEVTAAGLFGLMGGLNILGTIGAGMLCDRVANRRLVLSALYLFRGGSLLILPFISDSAALLAGFSIFYGLSWYATAPANQLLISDIFGRRSVGQVYGWVFFSHQVGGSFAAYLGGVTHVWFGDYQVAFVSAGLAGLAAAGLSLQIREGQRRPTAPEPAAA